MSPHTNLDVEYRGSGLGYAGDPNGMDVAPLTTVRVSGMQFSPFWLFGAVNVNLPEFVLYADDGRCLRARIQTESTMGNIDNLYILNEAQQVAFPDGVYIAASPEALAGLQSGGAGGGPALPATLVTLTLEDAIPEDVVRKAMIVVVEADPASQRSMQRIGELRAARPYMPLIVALRDSDMKLVRSLVRQGVNDVVALPFDLDQLSDALLDAAAGAEDPDKVDVAPAPLYAVLGSNGGCGATTIATHLAAELASHEGGCCLLDLDVQFGTAGSYLGVAGASSVADLLKAQSRLDGDLLRSVSVEHASGLQVVSAPQCDHAAGGCRQ